VDVRVGGRGLRVHLTDGLVLEAEGGRVEPDRLPGRQGRTLLAFLLAHHDRPVPREELAEALWDDHPPPTWEKALTVLVSRLRVLLTQCGVDGQQVLTNAFGCYQLSLPADGWLDVDAAETLADEAQAALARERWSDAASLARRAADIARRPVLPGEEGRWVDELRARMRETLLRSLDCLADAALAQHDEVSVAAASEAVECDPFRETGYQRLMRAYAATGNRAGALRAFEQCRRLLQDELGVEPDPATEAVYLEILRTRSRAPETAGPARSAPAATGTEPPPPPPRRRQLVALVTALSALAGTALVLLVDARSTDSSVVRPNSLVAVDVRTGRVVRAVGVGARPGDVVAAHGSLWVANLDDGTVSEVDPRGAALRRTVVVGKGLSHLSGDGQDVWLTTSSGDVSRISRTFGAVTALSRVPSSGYLTRPPRPLAVGLGSVWVVDPRGTVARLAASTGRVQAEQLAGQDAGAIAVGPDGAWVANSSDGTVTRIDRTDAVVATVAVGHGPSGVALSEDAVWVSNRLDDTVVRIDPSTNAVVATIRVGSGPEALVTGRGLVWVANRRSGTLSRIDAHLNRVTATVTLGASPAGLAFADQRLWVSAQSLAPAVSRGRVAHLAVSRDPSSIDPALADATTLQLHYATCAKLLNYPDLPAPQGFVLAPEVAESVPAPTDGGRTYRFVIRSGYRFAPPSGEPVTARTFAATIDRVLSPALRSPGAGFVSDVVGAAEVTSGRARHASGVVVSGRVLSIRLNAPSPDFLHRISLPFFCAVPSDAPAAGGGTEPIPSAGPYSIASYAPGQQLVLRENPAYDGPRPHRFSELVYTIGTGPDDALAQVRAGTADYVPDALPLGAHAELARSLGPGSAASAAGRQQYFVNPGPALRMVVMNTSRPLFADPSLRRAVSFALDRAALVEQQQRFFSSGNLGGGVATAAYLPPGFPGAAAASPYPLDRPDLTTARRLARGKGGVARLYTCPRSPCPEQAAVVVADLAAIGIRVEVRTFPKPVMFGRLVTVDEPWDLTLVGWAPDYPDPSQYLAPLLSRSGFGIANLSWYDDSKTERSLRSASLLSGPARVLAYGRLAEVVASQASPMAVYSADSVRDLFSARIGCQVYQPVYGMDLAALCPRAVSS
jgi:peptide/nickel transport system substrate-binding protein